MNSLPPEKMSEAEEARRKATPFFQRLRVLLTSPNCLPICSAIRQNHRRQLSDRAPGASRVNFFSDNL
jgi:hypothetical protein